MEKEKLTLKQEIFCQEWVDTVGNGTRAALKAFDIEGKEAYDLKETLFEEKARIESVAASMANEYLRKPNVSKRIDEILNERGFNEVSVKREHFKVIRQDDDLSVKQRGISDFYKLKGSYEPQKK